MNKYHRAHYADTITHKVLVFWYILKICRALAWRAIIHDLSKFSECEVRGFERARPIFERAEYGSSEYQEALNTLGPSLNHHYQSNSHHPEHFEGGVLRMSPIDQLEMLCDWAAASKRKNGSIYKSMNINADRFGLSDKMIEGFLSDLGEIGL